MNTRILLIGLACGLALALPRCGIAAGIPEIDVNTTTGDVTLNTQGVSLLGYEIDSDYPIGHLIPANWDTLTAQSLVTNWQVFIADSSYVAEGSNISNTPYTSSTPADLGDIFQPGSPQDLIFSYTDTTFGTFNGNVFYSSVPEPASALLGALGATALVAIAARKRSRI